MANRGCAREAGTILKQAAERLQAGQLAQSRALFAAAASVAGGAGDGDALVAAALGIGGLWVYEQRDFVERAALGALWERARHAVTPGSLAAARLEVRLAAEAVYEGGPIGAVEDAVGKLLTFGDDLARAEAHSLLHHVHLGPAYARSRLGLAEDIGRGAARANDPLLLLMGLCWRTVDLYLLGDRAADQSLQELRERSEGAGCAAIAFVGAVMGTMRLARAGDLAGAEAAGAAAADRGLAAGDPDALAYLWAQLGALRWWQGRGAEIIDEVRALGASPRLGSNAHVYVAADAALSAALGDTDAAEEALARLNGSGLGALPATSSWLTTQFLAAEAAFQLGDTRTAGEIRDLVAPYADLPVMPSLAVVCLGSAQRTLGVAAATCGDLDAAVGHLEQALRADQRLGSRPMAVLTEHTLSCVLRARGAEEDRARADALGRRAAARAERIGLALPAPPDWLESRALSRHQARLSPVAGGWRIEIDGQSTVIGDRVGMWYLVALIASPRTDQHVLRLAARFGAPGGAQAVLDRRALASYRARVSELTELIERPETDDRTARRLKDELDAIRRELRAATGRHGGSRDFTTDQERARTAVRKAILRAIESVRAADPALGGHLDRGVTTGLVCRYEPDAGWVVRVAPP
jgi:hypothetical protein